jgi:hypothetical protein
MRRYPIEQRRSANSRKKNGFAPGFFDDRCGSILLVGGPYQGMHIREEMDANGLFVVNGARGEFVYKLYMRRENQNIAVPFSASAREIRNALFRLAAQSPVARSQNQVGQR